MGTSTNSQNNSIVKYIWLFCSSNNIWLTVAHIPGVKNTIADHESRKIYKDEKWMLNPSIFKNNSKILKFNPNIDWFASNLNTQVLRYVSYKPDHFAYLIDAFSVHWGVYKCYLGQSIQEWIK